MRVSVPLVVAEWGVLNSALAVLLATLGWNVFALALYGSAAAVVATVAVVMLLSRRRNWREAPHGDTALAAAAGVVTAAVGAVVAYWVAVIAMLPFIIATVREISLRRRGPDNGHNGIGGRLNHIAAHRRAESGLGGTSCATRQQEGARGRVPAGVHALIARGRECAPGSAA